MTEHEHEWRRYVLGMPSDEEPEGRYYTQAPFDDVPGAYYVGYDCECGEVGYGLKR